MLHSLPFSTAGTKSSFSPAGLGFSLAQLLVKITMTADKSIVQMPYNASLMAEELLPNCHSRDFRVVSAPIKDMSWLGRGKTGIPTQGRNSEQGLHAMFPSLKRRHSSRLEKQVFFPLSRIYTREH